MLRVNAPRAAGAVQLAAALVASGRDPGRFEIACTDGRLSEAAGSEGFTLAAAV